MQAFRLKHAGTECVSRKHWKHWLAETSGSFFGSHIFHLIKGNNTELASDVASRRRIIHQWLTGFSLLHVQHLEGNHSWHELYYVDDF